MIRRFAVCFGALTLIVAACPAFAQEDAVAPHPGVIDIEWADYLDVGEPKVRVNLNRPVLKLMSAVTGKAPEVGELMGSLAMVRVEVYEGLRPESGHREVTAAQVKALRDSGWESVVRVRDGESVDVLVRPDGEDAIAGVMVLVAESQELVFVNIAGDINAERFGKHLGKVVGPIMKGDLKIEDLLEMGGADDLSDPFDG